MTDSNDPAFVDHRIPSLCGGVAYGTMTVFVWLQHLSTGWLGYSLRFPESDVSLMFPSLLLGITTVCATLGLCCGLSLDYFEQDEERKLCERDTLKAVACCSPCILLGGLLAVCIFVQL